MADNVIEFSVLGLPMCQKRHKQWHKGKHTGQVDPSAEAKREFLLKVQHHAPNRPWDDPVFLEVRFYFPRPQSHYRIVNGRKLLKNFPPCWYGVKRRHDIDNLLKFVMDALNGVFFIDDGQIVAARITKAYTDNQPGTFVHLKKIT